MPPYKKGEWAPHVLREVEEFVNKPPCKKKWPYHRLPKEMLVNGHNPFPFASVPEHRRHIAQARFDYYIAKCKAEGRELTQHRVASLMGAAARYANYVVTGDYMRAQRRRWFLANCARKLKIAKLKSEHLARFKELPPERRSKVLPT